MSLLVVLGCLFGILAGSNDAGGRFGLTGMVAPKDLEPSLHFHHDEGFYVLVGNLTSLYFPDRGDSNPGYSGAGWHRAALTGSSLSNPLAVRTKHLRQDRIGPESLPPHHHRARVG